MERGGALRPATRADLDRLPEMLARAFAKDPALAFVAGHDRRSHMRLRGAFGLYLSSMLGAGRCVTLKDGAGAALWVDPPGHLRPSPAAELAMITNGLRSMGYAALGRLALLQKRTGRLHPKGPPHAYLACLGVEPARHGQGLARTLLDERLIELDAAQVPAYLETANPANLPLYARFGFAVRDRIEVPEGGFSIWTMWRDPLSQSDRG